MTEENTNTAVNTEAADSVAEDVKSDAELDGNGNDSEFSDGETEGGRPEAGTEKSAESVNRENAHRRREQERARELEAARVEAIIEAVGENPFTHEELKDAEDVAEYLMMREIQKQGGDPLGDYAKHQKEKKRAEREAEAKTEKQEAWFRADREDFIKKYPDVDLDKLVADKSFAEYADGKVGQRPLAEIYEGYERFVKVSQKKADQRAAQALANSKASPGALSGGQAPESEYFTYEQVKAMTSDEVSKNYDRIRESMKTWKK